MCAGSASSIAELRHQRRLAVSAAAGPRARKRARQRQAQRRCGRGSGRHQLVQRRTAPPAMPPRARARQTRLDRTRRSDRGSGRRWRRRPRYSAALPAGRNTPKGRFWIGKSRSGAFADCTQLRSRGSCVSLRHRSCVMHALVAPFSAARIEMTPRPCQHWSNRAAAAAIRARSASDE